MKEILSGTLPNKKDVLRPTKTPKVKIKKEPIIEPVVDSTEPTLVETMKTISRNGFIKEKSSFSVLHIISFVLLIPAAIVAIPGFLILLLSDYLKED
jgi:hypothetical protein